MSNLKAKEKKESGINKMLVARKKMPEKYGRQNYTWDANTKNTSNISALMT